MANALDMYRAQQTAAKEVHAKLSEVSALVQQVRREVDALAKNHDLRDLIRQELTWLEQAERTVKEVRRWRELEAYRFWPGVVYRWTFALASRCSPWAANAGHAWVNERTGSRACSTSFTRGSTRPYRAARRRSRARRAAPSWQALAMEISFPHDPDADGRQVR